MTIGINSAAAFKRPRTGVEEYTYQLIRHLTMLEENKRHRFVLYSHQLSAADVQLLPENFQISQLKWPLPMWTQIRLASEMALNRPEVLFIPVHILPLIHPRNSVVTVHGLEYEYYPQMYPWRHLNYLRWSTKYALKKARRIIAVSENTKKDLIELYGGQPEKITVIHHGLSVPQFPPIYQRRKIPYILFIGRLEVKKNVQGLIKAFNLLKKKYRLPHQLVLVGPAGYGYEKVFARSRQMPSGNAKSPQRELFAQASARSFHFAKNHARSLQIVPEDTLPSPDIWDQIVFTNYVSEQEKWALLENAELFILPSFYEGFGIPIIEAQAVGCPVITSNISSMPEVAGQAALLVDPNNIEKIAEAMYKIISDNQLRKDLVDKGYANAKRFSWSGCARQTLEILTSL
jgi:glycosyltransferase involved in cell wall biosynthesis